MNGDSQVTCFESGEAGSAGLEVQAPARNSPWPRQRPASTLFHALQLGWKWLQQHGRLQVTARQRRLRVRETVSLGEKRFVSILEVDGASFLIGGTADNLTLIASHVPAPAQERNENFGTALQQAWERDGCL